MLAQIILFLFIILFFLLALFSFFTPDKQTNKKSPNTEDINWENQKDQARREQQAQKNKEWFAPARWLTDAEIDWAIARLPSNEIPGTFISKYKILPAHQFHLTREAKSKDDPLIFKQLLSELNTQAELVFIPVNNSNFHWSLLVYETKTKVFCHYDTLNGTNDNYIKPLINELLREIQQVNNPNLNNYLIFNNNIHQGNGYDCGVAVISLIKRIREKYTEDLKDIELGEFDFKQERKDLREKYLIENGE